MKGTSLVIEAIVIRHGETPWEFSDNPGIFPGPWGSEQSALQELQDDAGLTVIRTWMRSGVLWIEQGPEGVDE